MKLVKKVLASVLAASLATTSLFAAKENWPKEIKFGVIPVSGSTSLKENYTPIAKYLEEKLGVKVKLIFAGDYTGIITGMQHKHIDIANFGPKSYVEAAKRANAQAVVIEVDEKTGTAGYKAMIITKKGSGLKSLADIKGKTWAFTSSQSTSGTLVPTVMFKKEGIEPKEYFKKVMYSGGHEASVLSVKAGKIDAAAVASIDFDRGVGKQWSNDEFNFIWESELIAGSPIAVRGDLPQDLKDAVQKAFIEYKDPEGLKRLRLAGYIKTDDKTYDPIRELAKLK